jgi:hypothetical protein
MCGDRLIIEAIAGNSFSVALCQSLSDEMLHDERMAGPKKLLSSVPPQGERQLWVES